MAIKDFLKDKSIGVKRLASMPDRITNTINLKDGQVLMRPTVINAFNGGSLASIDDWWVLWKKFMFHTEIEIFVDNNAQGSQPQAVCNLISPILRGKYPAITVQEHAISIPLQILCLALLDSIFLFIMNSVAPGAWETVRRDLSNALIVNKFPKICDILAASYHDCDVIFLQEAAAIFARRAQEHPALRRRYAIL
eukprot:CAMPEP_0172152854 /NCGR_PEP_ID=MMETSP1050-20130122/1090_1 /TAXON_ID=233186 /ORGANISM="Cryptomonas curvata, Strain CCAP979/52" /LENGTH=194 /DNA_ID=CAMNT_0012821265 /DNA_START=183 /DNA_END=764 /DNA_ORIENTATION=+